MHRRVRHLNPKDCGAVIALDGRFGVSGSPVSTWTGRTGTTVNATQAGTLRPTTGTLNGVPSVVFDGTDDYMTVSDLTVYQNKSYGRGMAAVIDNSTAGSAQHPIFVWTNNASGSRFRLDTKNTTSGVMCFGRRLDADSLVNTALVGTPTSAVIAEVEANWTGNALTARANGIATSSVTYSSGGGSTSNTASGAGQIGGLQSSALYAPATIGAIVCWNATAAEALFRRVRHSLGFTFRIKTA